MPALINKTSVNASSAGTTATLTKPTGLEDDDVLYVSIGTFNQRTISAPAGWTILGQNFTDTGGNNVTVCVARKVIADAASEPASYAFTWTSNAKFSASIHIVRGADTADPESVGAVVINDAAAASITLTSVTADTNGALLLGATVGHNENVPLQPLSMMGVHRGSSTAGSAVSSHVAMGRVDSGATGTRVFTGPSGAASAGVLVAVNAATALTSAYVVDGQGSQTASDGTTHTVTMPTGAEDGDRLVAIVSFRTNTVVITPPVGWTELAADENTTMAGGVWTREASSEPASYNWTTDTSVKSSAAVLALRNVGEADVVGAITKAAASPVTGASITPTDVALVIGAGLTTAVVYTESSTAGFFAGNTVWATSPSTAATALTGFLYASAATGAKTWTLNNNEVNFGLLMSFLEEAPPDPPGPDVGGAGPGRIRSPRYGLTRVVR